MFVHSCTHYATLNPMSPCFTLSRILLTACQPKSSQQSALYPAIPDKLQVTEHLNTTTTVPYPERPEFK